MRRKLSVDARAEADLLEIWLYTHDRWSLDQADHYLDLLHDGLQRIVESPASGQDRSMLLPGYRSRSLLHHVVFYTFDDREVRVRRVLHASMDLRRHL